MRVTQSSIDTDDRVIIRYDPIRGPNIVVRSGVVLDRADGHLYVDEDGTDRELHIEPGTDAISIERDSTGYRDDKLGSLTGLWFAVPIQRGA